MSEGKFEEFSSHVLKTYYCNDFTVGGANPCPEIQIQCWTHPKMYNDCLACVLCDFLNVLDITMWKMYLPKPRCNLQKCPHLWVAHTCATCPCVCKSGPCQEDCVCDVCVPKYQEVPLIDSDMEADLESMYEEEQQCKKVNIPYADSLLEDAIGNLKLIKPEDYDDMEESVHDFCSAKNPDPPYEDPGLTPGPLIPCGTCGAPCTERPTGPHWRGCLKIGPRK